MAGEEQHSGPIACSEAKLDELFLQWLSLPEAQDYVLALLANAKKGKPLVNIPQGVAGGDKDTSPKSRPSVASPPPRSPTGRSPKQSSDGSKDASWLNDAKDKHLGEANKENNQHQSAAAGQGAGAQAAQGVVPMDLAASSQPQQSQKAPVSHQEDVPMPDRHPPAARRVIPGSAASLPRFYNPSATADALVEANKEEMQEMTKLFDANAAGLNKEAFMQFTTKVCGFPSYFSASLFTKVAGKDAVASRPKCQQWWNAHCKQKSAEHRLYNLLRNEKNKFVSREDWKEHLAALLEVHPGLDFLKGTPEFQERYLECVIERIYYINNRAENYKLTLNEILKSNLVKVLKYVDEEPDINKVMDYFSYEHFYVLYCKFWELDSDHDFYLDRDDLVKLSNYALTYRIVDRIFAGACRKLTADVPERLGYQDFIWLLLSEEDKSSETAIRYWFRGIDLDGDGYITPHEMEFFYKEQLHRMDCLAQEVVQFEDILCQMTDMVKPAKEGYITMIDLKKSKQAGVFFNVLFNLTKFIQYDQKDPTQIFNERNTPELTDWDRYAKIEYQRLSMEEDQGEFPEEGEWDLEQDQLP